MGDSTSQTPGALNSVHELGADSASNSDLPPAQIEAKPIEPEPIETISIETKFTWPPKAPAPDAETIGTAEGRAAARDAKSQTRARPLPAVERDRVSLPLDAGPEAPRRSGSNAYRRESDAPIPDTDSSSDTSIDLQPSPAAAPTSTWRDAIERFERRWLGLIHRSWRTRALAAGWRPDSPDTYCPSCGQDIARYELDTDQRCSACRGSRLAWDAFIRLGHHEALLRDAIHEIKFERSRALALDLGRQLGHAIRARMATGNRVVARVTPGRIALMCCAVLILVMLGLLFVGLPGGSHSGGGAMAGLASCVVAAVGGVFLHLWNLDRDGGTYQLVGLNLPKRSVTSGAMGLPGMLPEGVVMETAPVKRAVTQPREIVLPEDPDLAPRPSTSTSTRPSTSTSTSTRAAARVRARTTPRLGRRP